MQEQQDIPKPMRQFTAWRVIFIGKHHRCVAFSEYEPCLSAYNVIAGTEPVDLLVIDVQSYRDLNNALALSRLVQEEQELEEERFNQM